MPLTRTHLHSSESKTSRTKAPRVLIVDDEAIIRGFLGDALEGDGYEVRTAANGVEALDVLSRWHAGLILLDLMMPEMDGWTFRAEQRRRPDIADIPVVILSAALPRHVDAKGVDAVAVVPKPFDLDALMAIVAGQIGTPDERSA